MAWVSGSAFLGEPGRAHVEAWFAREAMLLDEPDEAMWFAEMVADRLDYRIGVRESRLRSRAPTKSRQDWYVEHDHTSLAVFLQRTTTRTGWAHDPPPLTRRVVGGVLPGEGNDEEFSVRSAFLLWWQDPHRENTCLLAGVRSDVLVVVEGELRLRKRDVLLDGVPVPVSHLGVLL